MLRQIRRNFLANSRFLIMNNQRQQPKQNDRNCFQPPLQQNFSNSSFNINLSCVHQESSSSQVQQDVLLNNLSHRYNFQQVRQISAFQHAYDKSQQHTNQPRNKVPGVKPYLKDKKQKTVWTGPLRQWTPMQKAHSGFNFKIMSYNVLAQALLESHSSLFPKTTHRPDCLLWKKRWDLLMREFKFHNASIICLQEVQESDYKDFQNFFTESGYEGIYKKRTGLKYPDGCAIFYKTKVFELIEHHSVEYFQSEASVLDRHNIGLIAKFSPRFKKNIQNGAFIVATTHLLFNPNREDVRFAQTQVLLTEINRLSYDYELRKNIPVILCGDFNSQINNAVFKFISEKHIEFDSIPKLKFIKKWILPDLGITDDCRHMGLVNNQYDKLTRSEEEQFIQLGHSEREPNNVQNQDNKDDNLFEGGVISHDFNFTSVYPNIDGVTTHQKEWVTVDYMFYSSSEDKSLGELICTGRYELPTESGINAKGIKGIPNCRAGSDHFSLVAKFSFDFTL